MSKLTEKTLIPLGLALSLIGGGAFWLSALSSKAEAHEKTINRFEEFMTRALDVALSIDRRVTRIEEKLDVLRKEQK